jgi:methionyl-tRNA synthetase
MINVKAAGGLLALVVGGKCARGQRCDILVRVLRRRREHDLADTFGNLVNRVLKFVAAKYDGVMPAAGEASELEHSLVPGIIATVAAPMRFRF